MTSNVNPLVAPDGTRHEVAASVRAHLAVRRMSDSALGRAIGMSQSKISRRTNGEIAFDTDDLGRIARALDVSIVELIQMPTTSMPATQKVLTQTGEDQYAVPPEGFEPPTSGTGNQRSIP